MLMLLATQRNMPSHQVLDTLNTPSCNAMRRNTLRIIVNQPYGVGRYFFKRVEGCLAADIMYSILGNFRC